MADLDLGDSGAGGALTSSSGGLTGSQWGALGGGALALGGLGYLASQGPTNVMSIPGYAQAFQQVPTLQGQSALTFGQGQGFLGQGAANLELAAKGQLTAPQQAKLDQDRQALQNQAAQTYAAMGRSGVDTSKISTQANIDQAMAVEANSFIQSTIALAGQQITAGQNLLGTSFNEASAATGILLQEGAAQVALNKQYSDNMASAFKAVGTVFGTAVGAYFGGPMGAAAGASIGGALGTEASKI